MLDRIGRRAASHPVRVIVAWVVAIILAWVIGLALGGKSDNTFTLPGAESQVALDDIATGFPEVAGASATLVMQAPDGKSIESSPYKDQVEETIKSVAQLPDVESVVNPYETPDSISSDKTTAIANVQYDKGTDSLPDQSAKSFEQLKQTVDGMAKDGLVIELGGVMPGSQMIAIDGMLVLYGLIAALIILLLALGTVWSFAWPVLSALLGVALGTGLVQILMKFLPIPQISGTVAVMVGLGVGIDYGLFVTARIKEESAKGQGPIDAAGIANASAGRAAVTAGATVIVALMALFVFGVPAINDMSYTIAITVICVVLAAITLMPAVLALVGKKINHGRLKFQSTEPIEKGMGTKWAGLMITLRWPAAIGGLVVLVLLMLPVLTGSLRLGPIDNSLFPPDSTQYKAQEIQTEKFGPGNPTPFLLVANLPVGDDQVRTQLDSIVKAVAATEGVASTTQAEVNATQTMAAFEVIPTTGAQDPATPDLVTTLRNDTLPKATAGTNIDVLVSGTNAVFVDLDNIILDRLISFILLVIVIAVIILGAVFRSVVVPLTAAVFNVLVVMATYGVIVMIFTWGWGLSILGVPDTVPLISLLAPMIFAVLFGLSNDYEVYLVSRMKEEYEESHDARRAVKYGHGTGIRIVIAAALIMFFVFASYAFQPGAVVKQAGLGMAIAILIDAFVVRMVLLPATAAIFGKAMWWFPGKEKPKQQPPASPPPDDATEPAAV